MNKKQFSILIMTILFGIFTAVVFTNPSLAESQYVKGPTGGFTTYAVICGPTTAGNPLQSIAGVGTSGQILTSNGASQLPTFQDPVATAPAGNDTEIQYNNAGVFGARENITTGTDGRITIGGSNGATATGQLTIRNAANDAVANLTTAATFGINGTPFTACNFGVVAALDGGTPGAATVSLASVSANTRIFLSYGVPGGAQAPLKVVSRSNGVSFTINGGTGDTSVVYWLALEP